MKPADIKRVAAAALPSFDLIMSDLGLDGGKRQGAEYLPLNPRRADAKPGSFCINCDSGTWSDFATGDKGGDLVSLAAYVLDVKQTEAAERLGKLLGIALPDAPQSPASASAGSGKAKASPATSKPASAPPSVCVMPVPADAPKPPVAHSRHGKPSGRWAYLDKTGAVLFYHCRFEPKGERKQFAPLTLWRKPSGALEWQYKAPPAPRPMAGLDRLAARPGAVVVVVEGEKAMDAGIVLLPEHVVTCWQGGAQAVDKSDWSPLAGRHVILWPDADEPGKGCMAKLAGLLVQAGAASVRVMNLHKLAATPGHDKIGNATLTSGTALEAGDDAADLVTRGWKAEHLALLLDDPGFLIEAAPLPVEPEKRSATGKTAPPSQPSTDTGATPPAKHQRFTVDDGGVWLNDTDREGNPAPRRWICSRLDVPAMVRDVDNQSWGRLVSFMDYDRKPHREIIPARDFRGEGLEVTERLLDRGLSIAPKARPLLIEYLQTAKTKKRARITSRTGWHDGVFVLPDCAFGAGTEEWLFETDTPSANTFKLKSTLAGWRDDVARLCRGNSRLVFSVSLGFASPLLQLAGAESGGFHFRSNSSDGKTTALRVAASVCGGQDYMQRWRATDNGLEALAMQHCDAALLLDEIAQIDPKAAGDVAYMLANGGGKTRSDRTGTRTRARASWRLLFLSAGEIGLAQHMAEAGKSVRAGQELRLAEIPADAGAGLGVFEQLHELESGSAFAKALDFATRKHHGTAFPAFLERLTAGMERIPDELHKAQKVFESKFLTGQASGQAHRVAHRFALVGAAGELATSWGITGWEPGEAMAAAGRCFNDWLAGRGGEGNQEECAMLGQVREILNRYGESAFTDWGRPAMNDDHAPVRSDRMGYRRTMENEVEYFIFPDLFRTRLCKGFDAAMVGKLLIARGYVERGDEKDRGEWVTRVSLPAEGKQRRMVHILPKIWEDE